MNYPTTASSPWSAASASVSASLGGTQVGLLGDAGRSLTSSTWGVGVGGGGGSSLFSPIDEEEEALLSSSSPSSYISRLHRELENGGVNNGAGMNGSNPFNAFRFHSSSTATPSIFDVDASTTTTNDRSARRTWLTNQALETALEVDESDDDVVEVINVDV
jgi:hypothetical protein